MKNELGKRYGNLRVISYAGRNKQRLAVWNCVCDCGNLTRVTGHDLRRRAKMCYDCKIENLRTINIKHGYARAAATRPEYRCWSNMHSRCYNPARLDFKLYGGRGIQICVRWHKSTPLAFQNFLQDMGERPSVRHSIDRINNEVSYMPSNCRWATDIEQANNRRPRSCLKLA